MVQNHGTIALNPALESAVVAALLQAAQNMKASHVPPDLAFREIAEAAFEVQTSLRAGISLLEPKGVTLVVEEGRLILRT